MEPVIERELSPVMVVRWPEQVSDDEVRAHFDEVRSILLEGRRAFVVDMRAARATSESLRKLVTWDVARLFVELGRARIAGVAHVLGSPLLQGLVAAVSWLFSPPLFPTFTTQDFDEALRWARGTLEAQPAQPG